jgi:thiol-disulfide isomerase/thioredoxin
VVRAEKENPNNLIEISSAKDYEQQLKKGNPVVVEVYWKDCPHCKAMGPRLIKVAQDIPEVTILKIDKDTEIGRQLKEQHKIGGFPTLLFFDNTGIKIHTKSGAPSIISLKELINEKFFGAKIKRS